MLQIRSVVDGFNVILGSWIVHLAAFLTMILAIRVPPTYEDNPERTKHGKIIFANFVILHLSLAVVKYLSLFSSPYFKDKMTIFIMWVVFTTCSLCQNWVFVNGRDTSALTVDQIKFERWLWIELMFVLSFIFGGAFYALVCKITRPCLLFSSPLLNTNSHGDFMETYGLLLDLTNNMSAPALVGILIASYGDEELDWIPSISGWLCVAQTLLFYFALFMTRVSEARSAFYIKVMPELTYYASVVALGLLPLTIIVLNIVGLFTIESFARLGPFMVFSIWVQVGIFAQYLIAFRGPFAYNFEEVKT